MPSPAVCAVLERLDRGLIRDVAGEFRLLTPDDMRELAMILVERARVHVETPLRESVDCDPSQQ
jgi:hypothetical protein